MDELIILVDEQDNEIGFIEKMKAHETEQLHRAFSIFIFNSKGEMLLQQRADSKYHSGGLWTNACCSHPRKGESLEQATHRRLSEELGFDCPLKPAFTFIYKAELDKGLTEHELDHVFIGTYDGAIQPNPDEVKSVKWMLPDELQRDLKTNPNNYTVWFKIAFERVLTFLSN